MESRGSPAPLKMRSIIGYGSGDFGLNLFYTGLNLYLLFYYTDVVGLAPGVAGTIFMVALLFDALTDPLMGTIASRTRTRFGRYRPYILFAGPVLGLSFVLLFAAPVFWPSVPILACFLTHILFRAVYTVIGVPYASLTAAMTRKGETRTALSGARMQFATLGAIATAFFTPYLADVLGGDSLVRGYMFTALIYAVLAEIVFLVTFLSVREEVETDFVRLKLGATLRAITGNRAFWILFAGVVINAVSSTIFTKSIVYYARYVIGEPGAVREALTFYTIAAGCAVLGWTLLARQTSKSFVLNIGLVFNAGVLLALYLIAPEEKPLFLFMTALVGVGMAATIVAFWAMLPDTVEYGQWKTGIRDEGIVFGLFQFSQKAASAIGVGAVGLILQVIGYVANVEQTAETLDSLRLISFAVPALGVVLAVLVLQFYPLKGRQHAEILNELEAREG